MSEHKFYDLLPSWQITSEAGDLCLGCAISMINIVPNDSTVCTRCKETVCIKCSVLPTPGCKNCALTYCDRCQGPLGLETCAVCLCCHDDAFICEKCAIEYCEKCKYAKCLKCKDTKCKCS